MKPTINFLFGMVTMFLAIAVWDKALPIELAAMVILALIITWVMGNPPSKGSKD